MPDIEPYRPDDRRGVEQLYRRTFGIQAADAVRLRWDWARRNPANQGGEPFHWIVREGPTVVAACPLMPVRVSIRGLDADGAWSTDPLVIAERQRQGLGEALLRAWDRQSGVALGASLSDGTRYLLEKIRWPKPVTLPCLVKPLSRRALRQPTWPQSINRLVSYVTLPWVRLVARTKPLQGEVRTVRNFDDSFTRLWERVRSEFSFAVRRDAPYLNWKYIQAPHVRYLVAVLERAGQAAGYAVYRHKQEPRGRVTLLVDFLTAPDDESGMFTLLRWVDREARAADSDKIRTFAMHDGFRKLLRKSGYYAVKSTMEFVVKVNAMDVPASYYKDTSRWHVTLGDSDQDR
jgi:hypothetical protein